MASLRRHEGYLLIDHSQSPGTAAVPAGMTYESATYTCSHCHRIVVLNPDRTRPREYCAKCDHVICDGCAAVAAVSLDHVPMAQRLDQLQRDAATVL